MIYEILHIPQERVQRRRVPVRPLLSHGMAEDVKHVNDQARVRGRHLRLHVLPECRALPQILHGNVTKLVALHPDRSGAIRTKAPGCVGPRRLWSRFPSATPGCETRVRLDCCLKCVLSRVLGSTVGCGAAERCGCRTSRGGLNHTPSVEHATPLPTWEAYRSVLELERHTADLARHVSPGVAQKGTGARPVPRLPLLRP